MARLVYSASSKRISWETESGVATLSYTGSISKKPDSKQIEFQTILGILKVEKNELYEEFLACVTKSTLVGMYDAVEIYKIDKIRFLNINNPSRADEIMSQVKGFVQSHDFYYFSGFLSIEDEFVWNKHMKTNLLRYLGPSSYPWVLSHRPGRDPLNLSIPTLFCGFFAAEAFKASGDFYHMKLLSLVSSNRVGTRYLCRGIDSEGNASLFVKTHFQTKRNNSTIFDFTTIRGSVPIFWNQIEHGISTKINIYGDDEDVRKAFKKHFVKLGKEYGKVHVINLLGEKKYEKRLTSYFSKLLNLENIPYTTFDLNAHANNYDDLKFLLYFKLRSIEQEGVIFRVNCLDCLDRTNVAQSLICMFYFEKAVNDGDVLKKMQECWADNGNSLSNLYTGSDAMKKELALKGRRSFIGYMDDFMISATRLINGRFTDRQKHSIINILLEKREDSEESQVSY
ncbi:phosphoinositide polyphosphatase [Encephalitozoon hellem ATCC 50504]|uniref:Phosphoinositide polyphosphatase n=1 Tax=Encephalitozoon hellem TaxID=27973 RepID=A0A9Q9CDE7_ENCHE|nr:phosphoinositide polyphosphatase [Encephalitozoon hellem ATCC 50504]AFM98840.1 phosphoinositide polyphosphatase [Encephalitozoon hellem ATCC 50504]UTX43818.1 phosphoinositide polyphosphatase [Encephalitozoon hellem]|eukprot:XP_003887821.1 phosphoinositide polyphosphatase [Encephalitozoon hellem ATCC 50504]